MTKVKLCGLRRPQDIKAANRLRPDYIGFVFAPGRRRVSPAEAAALREKLADGITAVGVFVNAPLEEIAALCRDGIIDLVQLHGEEGKADIARIKDKTGAPVIKALPVGDMLPPMPAGADYLLYDTLGPVRGGTGQAFDWGLLRGYEGTPYFLAGGLGPENVAEAIGTLAPYAVDVSSGVETDGWKDPQKMAAFVQAARRIQA